MKIDLEDLKWNIEYYSKLPIRYFRYANYSIINLFVWFKVIWSDRNWDHVYLYHILKFKLNRMIIALEFGHCENAQAVRDIKTCIRLIDKIIEDDFMGKCTDYAGNWNCKVKFWDYEQRLKQKHLDLLHKIMAKRSMRWWD